MHKLTAQKGSVVNAVDWEPERHVHCMYHRQLPCITMQAICPTYDAVASQLSSPGEMCPMLPVQLAVFTLQNNFLKGYNYWASPGIMGSWD